MWLLLTLALAVALAQGYVVPRTLTASQIGMAKKQCQQNCHHVPSNGRNRVLHNRCVQTCWNEFFASMTNHAAAPPKSGPHTNGGGGAGPVMRSVPKGSKDSLLKIIAANNKHAKQVLAQRAARARGAPITAAYVAVPTLLLAVLLAVVM